ncbi:MAG: putative signal transduction histidine kinase [Bacteroidetes bacterium]|nr:MAG: putative signal transduction histidine kinase [Bacteroidota bacterium]
MRSGKTMMKCRTWGICLVLHLIMTGLSAQELFFRSIGTDQGLPSSETYQLLQDKNGYIWIATDGGVSRYDGSSVTNFTTKEGLSENVILGLYEDRKGRIWFRALSGEISFFDGEKITGIAANPELRKIMNRCFITSFFLGEMDTLYCGTGGTNDVIKIPPAGNYKKIIHQKFSGAKVFILENKTRKRELLAGFTSDMNPRAVTVVSCEGKLVPIALRTIPAVFDNACRVMKDREGNTWTCNFKELAKISPEGKTTYYLFDHEILKVYQDHDGDLWLGMKRGGVFFYKDSKLDREPLHFLREQSVADILHDREGSIWICTTDKGVFQSLSKNIFIVETGNEKVAEFFRTSGSLHIAIAPRKELVVAATGSISYKEKSMDALPASGELMHLCGTSGGFFYATNQGLFFFDGDGRAKEIMDGEKHISYVRSILPAGEDSVFLTGYGNYSFIVNQSLRLQKTTPFIINAATRLRNGKIIFGTRGQNGLFQLEGDSFRSFLPAFGELKTRVNCLAEDDQGNLWIGTSEKGVFCYSGNKLYSFHEQAELPSNKINALDFDGQGHLWLATNKGLCKIEYPSGPGKATVQAFGKNNGLPGTETEKLVYFNQRIWCATKEQLFYFDPVRLSKNPVAPPVLIRSVSVNAKPVDAAEKKELQYDENNVSFVLNGMTFRRRNEKEYMYKLEGYDSDWQRSSTGNVQYTNLPPGTYSFISYALNDSGVKSAEPAKWNFSIRKPFWLTSWFITGMILLAIAAGYLMAMRWVARVRRREREKAKLSKMLSEFQLTALRAQMNPHFIFNAISSIQHYILQNEVQQSYNYLAKFSKLIRNVLDHSKEEELLLGAEMETLQLYVELEQLRFNEPFAFRLELDPGIDPESMYIPTMLIQPFLENAIWHGLMPKQGGGTLVLIFRRQPSGMEIIIEDNGIGREASARQKREHESRGMQIVGERIAVLNTKPGGGYMLHVTDLKNKAGEACGTRIALFIPAIHE